MQTNSFLKMRVKYNSASIPGNHILQWEEKAKYTSVQLQKGPEIICILELLLLPVGVGLKTEGNLYVVCIAGKIPCSRQSKTPVLLWLMVYEGKPMSPENNHSFLETVLWH